MPRDAYQPKIKPTHAAAVRRATCEQRIRELLAVELMSNHELGAALGLSRSGAQNYTSSMLARREIFIAEWRHTNAGGAPRAYYGLGDNPDVAFIPVKPVSDPARNPHLLAAQNRRAIVLALATPRTSDEIAAHCHLGESTATKHIAALRAEKKARITSWRRAKNGKAWQPVYVLGSDPDAPRPAGTVRNRAQPDRAAADKRNSAKIGEEAARALVQKTIDQARARPHGFFAALGV